MLSEAENPAAELVAIRNTLLQYMSELKQIFRYYSQPVVSGNGVVLYCIVLYYIVLCYIYYIILLTARGEWQ